MKCPNCGNVSDSNAKFCCVCGAKLEERKSSETETSKTEDKTENKTENATKAQTENKVEQNVEQKTEHKTTQKSKPEAKKTIAEPKKQSPVQKKKRKRIPEIVIAGGLCAVIVAAGVFALTNMKQTDNPIVYLSDGSHNLLTGLEKADGIEFADGVIGEQFSYNDYWINSNTQFSPGGKYFYFYSDADYVNYRGSLCRVKWDKIRANSSREKISENIEIISSNIIGGEESFTVLSDDEVVYKDLDGSLYYYNGKDTIRLAKNVNNFKAENDRIIYTRADDNERESYTLYGITTDDLDDKKKLATNVRYIISDDDMENIFLCMKPSEEDTILGVAGFSKDLQILGEKTRVLKYDKDCIYYLDRTGETLNLYDYVEGTEILDTLKEPVIEDFQEARVEYDMLDSDSDLDEYEEMYTSCSIRPLFLSEGECLSDQPEPEFQKFVNNYKNLEDENGYIAVTPEIATDLRELTKLYGEGYDNEWLEFCFGKRTEYVTDEAAYDAAWEQYYDLSDTEYLCNSLKSESNAYPLRNLYCYKNGEISLLAEDVLDYQNGESCFAYNTKDMIDKKVKLEDVSECSDVTELFYIDYAKENYFIRLSDGKKLQMSNEGAEYWNEKMENSWGSVYMVGDNVYIEGGEEIGIASVENDKIGSFTQIANNSMILKIHEDEIYYVVDEDNDGTYYDLYCRKDGQSNLIAKGITLYSISVYEDGKIVASTSNDGYELSISGLHANMEYVADDVSVYWRLNADDLLYISDGDLYLYDGKNKELLAYDVDYVWPLKTMDMKFQRWG